MASSPIAIIGGSGLAALNDITAVESRVVDTPYGPPSAALKIGQIYDRPVVFLTRHGSPHTIAPHRVNYRANIWALHAMGVKQVIAVNAVGGITSAYGPEVICTPDQIIDYTYGREHSFLDGDVMPLDHVDFSRPYCDLIREALIHAGKELKVDIEPSATYGCTQGPRLETAAEIERLRRDGCDIVGMTAMPEAALARELKLAYGSLSLVVNWAAGCTDNVITMAGIEEVLSSGMQRIERLLKLAVSKLSS